MLSKLKPNSSTYTGTSLYKSYFSLILVLSGIVKSNSFSVPVTNKYFGTRRLQGRRLQCSLSQGQSNRKVVRSTEEWVSRQQNDRAGLSSLFLSNLGEFQASESVTTETLNLDDDRDELPRHALPSLDDSSISKMGKEFYGMMYDFQRFTPKDINSVEDVRYRALFEGVAAGATEPAVLKAFGVLFEDFRPIRLAGRMIYRHLKNVMEKNIRDKQLEDEKISCATGLTSEEIASGRRAFMAIQDEGGCEGDMTMDQLVESGIVDTVVELLGYATFEEFRDTMALSNDETAKFNFEKFMIGLQRCKDGSCDVQCELTEVFDEIVKRMSSIEKKRSKMTLPQRQKKYSDRYDEMVKSFEEWESLVPEGDGRMVIVLKGCFAGAKNEKVVAALKIVYMDYSALRIGGDLVFKLMSKLVGKQ